MVKISKKIKMIKKIKKFNYFKQFDGYIIPKNDEYFTEYSKINNLEKVTNFTGSAGFILILKKKIIYLLMVDIQFKQKNNQEKNLKFMKFHIIWPKDLKILKKKIGFDPKLFTKIYY